MTLRAVDLFAGPGGWDVAARALGMDVVGIEFDHAACETRRAAGFQTIEDDVSHYGPADFPDATMLIASPPCQTFSAAGKGAGRAALDTVLTVLVEMVGGRRVAPGDFDDPRTALVLEPLRWILDAHHASRPFRRVALEQVPTVLPVWQAYGAVMRELGYSVATGNLQAEQFGVPQTRKRAILIASLDHEVTLPTPTHSRFHTRDKARLDPGVLPWVSMAECFPWGARAIELGWTMAGSGSTCQIVDPRLVTEPAQTITGAGNAEWGKRTTRAAGPRDRDPWATELPPDQAATLQSFPSGYPWRGSKTKQYQQIGNAIPPKFALAVLRTLL